MGLMPMSPNTRPSDLTMPPIQEGLFSSRLLQHPDREKPRFASEVVFSPEKKEIEVQFRRMYAAAPPI